MRSTVSNAYKWNYKSVSFAEGPLALGANRWLIARGAGANSAKPAIGIIEGEQPPPPMNFMSDISTAGELPADRGEKPMRKWTACLLLPLALFSACTRHKPAVDAVRPYAQEQTAARDRVEARGRYDVNHDPRDAMSVNSMGSD